MSKIYTVKSKADLILFITQITIVSIVIIVSLINLTLNVGNKNLWTIILTSSLGYLMPNPKLKICKKFIKAVENEIEGEI